MKKKAHQAILIILMIIATADFIYGYIHSGIFNFYNLGAMYMACGIGLNALGNSDTIQNVSD